MSLTFIPDDNYRKVDKEEYAKLFNILLLKYSHDWTKHLLDGWTCRFHSRITCHFHTGIKSPFEPIVAYKEKEDDYYIINNEILFESIIKEYKEDIINRIKKYKEQTFLCNLDWEELIK